MGERQLIDVIIVSKLCNTFKGATFYWGEVEQGVEEGKVSPKQNIDERSMWALEGRAIQAEGTAPGWDRAAWEQQGKGWGWGIAASHGGWGWGTRLVEKLA